MSDDRPQPERNLTGRYALSVLTMRLNTPVGEWLEGPFEAAYLEEWKELVAVIGKDDADEYVLLDMLNMAMHLTLWLEQATGLGRDHWLGRLRDEYVLPAEEEPGDDV